MKVKYCSPAMPFGGIELETEYELTIKGNKAVITREGFSLELTKHQGETLFEEVKQ